MFEWDVDLQLRPNERNIFLHTPDFQLRASLNRDNPEQIETWSVTVRGTRSERKGKPQKNNVSRWEQTAGVKRRHVPLLKKECQWNWKKEWKNISKNRSLRRSQDCFLCKHWTIFPWAKFPPCFKKCWSKSSNLFRSNRGDGHRLTL